MANFDLSEFALKCVCPNNEILYDDKGLPSVMVYIPKFKNSDVISGGSDSTHLAFIVNGTEIDGIYLSKYPNIVKGGRAYSLPGQDPRSSVTFDAARKYCEDKGEGWHCMTRAEFAAIALWCKKNGWLPFGNNNYGKDSRETMYKGKPMMYDTDGKTLHIATGSGPIEYSHDKTVNGIWDLNGNVSEWQGGIRTVKGELQVLVNNNAADDDNSQATSSAQWMAIDAETGDYVTPAGGGSTTGTIKMDYVSNHWMYDTNITSQKSESRNCAFVNVTASSNVSSSAKEKLMALALLPDDTTFDYEGDVLYANNGEAERCFTAGGTYAYGASAGVFCLNGNHARSHSFTLIGFRAAYAKLPTA